MLEIVGGLWVGEGGRGSGGGRETRIRSEVANLRVPRDATVCSDDRVISQGLALLCNTSRTSLDAFGRVGRRRRIVI